MAFINGTSLEFLSATRNNDDPATRLDGAQSFASMVVGGVTYIYTASRNSDAIQVFTMDEDGTLAAVGAVADTAGITLRGVWEIEAFDVKGVPFLAAGGEFDDGITLFSLTNSPPYLTFANRVLDSDNPDFRLDGPVGLSVAQVQSGTYLYVSAFGDVGVSVFRVGEDASLTNVQNVVNDGAEWRLSGALSNFTFTQGKATYFVAMGGQSNAVNIASINPSTGMLTPLDAYVAGALDRPWGGSAKVIDGTPYLYIGSERNDSIVVLRWTGSALEEVQVISSQSLLGTARFTEVIEVGDRSLLYGQSETGDTFSIFEIDTNPLSSAKGRLSPLETIPDNAGLGFLDGAQEGHAVTIGTRQFLLTAASRDDAVNVYEIGGGDDVLEGTRFADVIRGQGGDDIIYGFAGDDRLHGGPGDDVIYGGSGDDILYISPGQDALYGGSGIDIVTALEFDMSSASTGMRIDLLRNTITLPDGTLQFVTGVENAFGTALADTIVGNDVANLLIGGDGNDTLRGRDGDDTLVGGNGHDRLFGAGGDDVLDGGDGNDVLQGGAGRDVLNGGAGDDRIFGGAGDDIVNAGSGDDRIKGNEGNDLVRGGGGNDIIEGQQGDDDLRGEGGNDILIGGAGRDTLNGGSGNDVLTGGSAIDTFVFAPVAQGGGGVNRITDFQDGLDLIDVSGYGFSGFAALSVLLSQQGADARINFADGQVVRIENLLVGDLSSADFIF